MKKALLCLQTHEHTTKPHQQARKQQKKKIRQQRQTRVQAAVPNKASKQKQSPVTLRQSHALLPV